MKKVTLQEVRDAVGESDINLGICALADVENIGWCKDGTTRWYAFELGGEQYIYFKY